MTLQLRNSSGSNEGRRRRREFKVLPVEAIPRKALIAISSRGNLPLLGEAFAGSNPPWTNRWLGMQFVNQVFALTLTFQRL